MTQLNESKVAKVNKIITKGDPIVIAGTTESGKSTSIDFLAYGDAVRHLLSMREASGKGSTTETNIVVTDSEDVSENEMIVSGKIVKNHIANCSDDNAFLAKVLHPAVKKYEAKYTEAAFLEEIKKNILAEINNPSNESLAYKIKDFSQQELDKLASSVVAFPFDKLVITLNEARAVCEQKYSAKSRSKQERRIFIELISENQDFMGYINYFWYCIIEILDRQAEKVIDMLFDAGAIISDERDSFMIALGDEDYDSELANILLRSEDGSKEFLFQEMSIVFRGNQNLFENKLNKYLVVTERAGKEIHCIRCVDSMGLFHSAGVTPEDEAERIIDLIAKNHADKLVLVVNSHVTDTVKDGYDAIRGMLRKMKRDIEIYIIYTHWDEYIRDVANKLNISNRRSRSTVAIDWDSVYQKAEEQQERLTESFKKSINENTNGIVPHIAGVFSASILLNDGTAAEKVLINKGVDYELSWEKLIECMLTSINKKGPKFKVKEGLLEQCAIIDNSSLIDAKQLYRNLVVDCKGHKYWASSVRAVDSKWRFAGEKHDSDIKENPYGYMNIHSDFVVAMRNFAMNILNNTNCVNISIDSYVVNEDDIPEMRSQLVQYLKNGQNFGREFAKLVGQASYDNGFKCNNNFCYQYQRLTDMFQYTQDNYFKGEKVCFSGLIVECMEASLRKCVKDFMDAKCIEVY